MSTTTSNPLHSAAIAHALSHPVRIEILALLREADFTVSEITAKLDRPQANISQHLAALREVNLVESTRNGMSVEYRLSASAIAPLLGLLAELGERISADELISRGRGRRRGGGRGQGRGNRRRKE